MNDTPLGSHVVILRSLPGSLGRGDRLESVYRAIKEAILDRSLPPGTPLTEIDIATQLGVSRTPVREALRELEQERLVVRGTRGMEVSSATPNDVFEIYDVRIALEEFAAQSAATRRTLGDIAQLRSILRIGEQIERDNPEALVQANERFHRAIWTAAHSTVLVDLLERLHTFLARFPSTTLQYPGRWDTARMEHAEIAAAIEASDPVTAGQLARVHFEHARDIRLEQV